MFEQLDQKMAKSRLRWTVWLGVTCVAGLIGMTVLAPKVWPQQMDLVKLAKERLYAPLPPAAPGRPHVKVVGAPVPPRKGGKTTKVFVFRPELVQPPAVPPKVWINEEDVPVFNSPNSGGPGIPSGPGVPGGPGDPGCFGPGCVIGGPGDRAFPTPPPPAAKPKPEPPKAPEPPKQIVVGGNVQQAKLVSQPKPLYPELAKKARVQGTVRFNAIIGKDGNIQDLRVASGHPLLVPAAFEAVKQWKYRATTLNDQPVEVLTQIDVNFTLTQ